MFRGLMTYLALAIYLAMQMVTVPHSHSAMNGHSDGHGAKHLHCGLASDGYHHHHHHDSDHRHDAHNHQGHPRTPDEAPPISNTLPHDADAVYVGDALIASAVRIAQFDTHDVSPALTDSGLSGCPPGDFGAQVRTLESAETFFAGANLYLILRALRI